MSRWSRRGVRYDSATLGLIRERYPQGPVFAGGSFWYQGARIRAGRKQRRS